MVPLEKSAQDVYFIVQKRTQLILETATIRKGVKYNQMRVFITGYSQSL